MKTFVSTFLSNSLHITVQHVISDMEQVCCVKNIFDVILYGHSDLLFGLIFSEIEYYSLSRNILLYLWIIHIFTEGGFYNQLDVDPSPKVCLFLPFEVTKNII